MRIDNDGLKHIRSFVDDPTDSSARSGLGLIYWSSVIDSLCDQINDGENIEAYIDAEKAFIDAGAFPKISGESDVALKTIYDSSLDYKHVEICSFSNMIKKILKKIYAGDKKDSLEREIKGAGIKKNRIVSQFKEVQQKRKELLLSALSEKGDKKQFALIERLTEIDEEVYKNLVIKRSIARGKFMDVDTKRKFVGESKLLEDKLRFVEALYSNVTDLKQKGELRALRKKVDQCQTVILDYEDTIIRKNEELDKINRESSEISSMEVEAKLRKELEFIRDNVKLCAKRVKQDNFATFVPASKYFSVSKIKECFDIILEFDPEIFHNDRVNVFGRPSVLMVPGNGNGIFDWKNNTFIIPLSPYGADFMVSIASAVIEYRLDVDEDKTLITQYQKLPKMKTVRSIIALKESLTKDYIKWCTSEYQGFKVLEKEHRQWFEHEIAPSRQEIYCPPELQMYALTMEESKELCEEYLSNIEEGKDKPNSLWRASIITYQNGDYQKAYSLIKEASQLETKERFLFYNLGIMSIKAGRKQEAIDGFSKFISENPQGWWTSVARDHVRRLQMG